MVEDLYTGSCIRTFSGKYINVFDPTPDMFRIEDVAHALSQMPRFAGHLRFFYSVGAHSLMCCAEARTMGLDSRAEMNLLMHDSSEAYLMDLPRPIKMRVDGYKELEHNLMLQMAKVFDFDYPFPDYVKDIDRYMLELEWRVLMLKEGTFSQQAYAMEVVEKDFLTKYYWLKGGTKANS